MSQFPTQGQSKVVNTGYFKGYVCLQTRTWLSTKQALKSLLVFQPETASEQTNDCRHLQESLPENSKFTKHRAKKWVSEQLMSDDSIPWVGSEWFVKSVFYLCICVCSILCLLKLKTYFSQPLLLTVARSMLLLAAPLLSGVALHAFVLCWRARARAPNRPPSVYSKLISRLM